jgi:hypothetical protein
MGDPLVKDEKGKQQQPSLEEQKIALERYKARLDFWKFIGASVFAAIAIAAIPPGFQWATNKLEGARKDRELLQSQASFHDNYVKDFLEKALNQDVEIRIRLATYFSNVSDTTYKQGWDAYLKQIGDLRDKLRTEINNDEQKLFELQKSDPDNVAEIAKFKRNLAWKYGELGYSEPNRDVVRDPRSTPVNRPATSPDLTVLSTTGNTSEIAGCLASAGFKYVARFYLTTPTSRSQSITANEVAALASHGIRVIAIQQQEFRDRKFVDVFSADTGTEVSTKTFNAARSVGQPGGTPIFFDVPSTISAADIETGLKPFFESVDRVNKSEADPARRYRIGVYGPYNVIQGLRDAGLIELGWIKFASWLQIATTYNFIAPRSDLKWDLHSNNFYEDPPCGSWDAIRGTINPQVSGTDLSFSLRS